MATTEELRLKLIADDEAKAKHKEWLAEEIYVALVTFPIDMQQNLNCTSTYMRLDEVPTWLQEQYDNDEFGLFTLKVKKKTNGWFEKLPEADY